MNYSVIPFAGPQPFAQQPYGWGGQPHLGLGAFRGLIGPIVTYALLPTALAAGAPIADVVTNQNNIRTAILTGALVEGALALVGY